MRLRKATLVALLTAALLADGAAVASAGPPATIPKATSPSVAASVPLPDGGDALDAHEHTTRPDTFAWQSRVGAEPFAAATNLNVHRVDVVVAAPSGVSKTKTATWIRNRDVDRLLSKVSAYWSAESGAKIRFVRQTPIKRIATSGASCTSTNKILEQVKRAGDQHYGSGWFTSDTRGPNRREHLVVLFPYKRSDFPGSSNYGITCGDGTLGLGSVPPKAGWNSPGGWSFNLFGGPNGAARSDRFDHYQYSKAVSTVAHELGHNMGLLHSSVGWCESEEDGRFRGPDCGVAEGVDPLDLMGWDVAATGTSPLSGAQKARLGVLPASDLRVARAADGNRTVTLSARHLQNSLRTLVKAVDPVTGDTYNIELRRKSPGLRFGFVGGLPWQAFNDYRISYGVAVSRVAPGNSTWAFGGEHLLVPMGPRDDRRSYMHTGETFTSRSGGLAIRVVESSETSARLRIAFPLN